MQDDLAWSSNINDAARHRKRVRTFEHIQGPLEVVTGIHVIHWETCKPHRTENFCRVSQSLSRLFLQGAMNILKPRGRGSLVLAVPRKSYVHLRDGAGLRGRGPRYRRVRGHTAATERGSLRPAVAGRPWTVGHTEAERRSEFAPDRGDGMNHTHEK